jgi:hypothetical protein
MKTSEPDDITAMTTQIDKALDTLSARLAEYKKLDLSERHIFLLWIITQGLTLTGAERPILVGGGAVEFFTGVRFATGDLDIVAPDKALCEMVLLSLGFEKPATGRHFISRSLGTLVDVHGSRLVGSEKTVELVYRKVPLLLVSPEDCIAERLASYRRHGSSLDLLNAFLIVYHNKERLNLDHLHQRIGSLDLWDYFSSVQDVSRGLDYHQRGVDEAAGEIIRIMKEGPQPCAF